MGEFDEPKLRVDTINDPTRTETLRVKRIDILLVLLP